MIKNGEHDEMSSGLLKSEEHDGKCPRHPGTRNRLDSASTIGLQSCQSRRIGTLQKPAELST